MNQKSIASSSWRGSWSGSFTLLISLLSSKAFTGEFPRVFNNHHIDCIVYYKQGVCYGFLSLESLDPLIDFVINKVKQDEAYLTSACQKLKDFTDNLNNLFSKDTNFFFNSTNLKNLILEVEKFTAFQNVLKELPNYLEKDLLDKYFPLLANARHYSEHIYWDFDKVLDKIIKIIETNTNYNKNQLSCLTYEELDTYIKEKTLPNQEILNKRYQKSAFLCTWPVRELTNKEITVLEEKIFSKTKNIKGNPAYKGKVTGMTDPSSLPIMRKAKAIVTDAGGILCHAAIVARELKIPCIIGTNNATTVLKTGDLVEVDANTGIVRKL